LVVSNPVRIRGEKRTFGSWKSDVTHAIAFLRQSGMQVILASPKGGPIQLDDPATNVERLRYLNYDFTSMGVMNKNDAQEAFENSIPLHAIRAEDAQAILIAGGIGALQSLHNDATLLALVVKMYEQGKIVAATGHGVSVLLNARIDGKVSLLRGRRFTGFSREEVPSLRNLLDTKRLSYDIETESQHLGGLFSFRPSLKPYMIQDGRIITGQQHKSTDLVLRRMREVLSPPSSVAAGMSP
jgi:putative intracellular protease/amidase